VASQLQNKISAQVDAEVPFVMENVVQTHRHALAWSTHIGKLKILEKALTNCTANKSLHLKEF